jgi:hypothetical protein
MRETWGPVPCGRRLLELCIVFATVPVLAAQEGQPAKGAALKVFAAVDGYTQATMFNEQKYPFKYKGSSTLNAEQVKALAKAGDVPVEVTKALLGCLLWPKQDDTLEKAALKSDGKRLTGEAEVLRKYGKQGTHRLKLRLEGTVQENHLTLKVVESNVSGSWNYGGGSVDLKGKVEVTFQVERP